MRRIASGIALHDNRHACSNPLRNQVRVLVRWAYHPDHRLAGLSCSRDPANGRGVTNFGDGRTGRTAALYVRGGDESAPVLSNLTSAVDRRERRSTPPR